MSKLIRLWDRSRTTTDWTCSRKRFWQYEYLGKGIVKQTTSLELFTGILVHDSLATIAQSTKDGIDVPINEIAEAAFQQMYEQLMGAVEGQEGAEDFANEQSTLIEGLIRGFYKHAWPRLLAEYPELLFVEEEMSYTEEGSDDAEASPAETTQAEQVGAADEAGTSFLFMAKPDLIARGPGGVAYIEYKTTKSKKEEWINSWETAVQLHSTIKAVKQTKGVDVDHVIVQGLYKGYESYGKQSSPFCYGYFRSGNPPFTKDELRYDYKPGFYRKPTWELPGGVASWIEGMPENVLADQFPRTAPIFINDELVGAFFRQRFAREREIEAGMEELEKYKDNPGMTEFVMDVVFPQKFEQCVPGYGRPCEYKKLCFGRVDDPLSEGFEWRKPHHEAELVQWGESDGTLD